MDAFVVGCAGSNAAGKDSFADRLVERHGFCHMSLSDIIREEVTLRSLEMTRDNLREVGNEMRAKEGHDVLAKRAMAKFESRGKYVITSIRHPAEIEALRTVPSWRMIYVDAPVELRFERLRSRARVGDDSTLEQFRANEEKELASANPAGQKILACKEMADELWANDGTFDEFNAKVDAYVSALGL